MRRALSVSLQEEIINYIDYIARKTGLVRSRVVEALILYSLKSVGYEAENDPEHLIKVFREVVRGEEG